MTGLEAPRGRFELRWRELMRAARSGTGLRLRPGAWAVPLIAFAAGLALARRRRGRSAAPRPSHPRLG